MSCYTLLARACLLATLPLRMARETPCSGNGPMSWPVAWLLESTEGMAGGTSSRAVSGRSIGCAQQESSSEGLCVSALGSILFGRNQGAGSHAAVSCAKRVAPFP